MKTIDKMIEVMEAFRDRIQIESKHRYAIIGEEYPDWSDEKYPSWDWFSYDYRIKDRKEESDDMSRCSTCRHYNEILGAYDTLGNNYYCRSCYKGSRWLEGDN